MLARWLHVSSMGRRADHGQRGTHADDASIIGPEDSDEEDDAQRLYDAGSNACGDYPYLLSIIDSFYLSNFSMYRLYC